MVIAWHALRFPMSIPLDTRRVDATPSAFRLVPAVSVGTWTIELSTTVTTSAAAGGDFNSAVPAAVRDDDASQEYQTLFDATHFRLIAAAQKSWEGRWSGPADLPLCQERGRHNHAMAYLPSPLVRYHNLPARSIGDVTGLEPGLSWQAGVWHQFEIHLKCRLADTEIAIVSFFSDSSIFAGIAALEASGKIIVHWSAPLAGTFRVEVSIDGINPATSWAVSLKNGPLNFTVADPRGSLSFLAKWPTKVCPSGRAATYMGRWLSCDVPFVKGAVPSEFGPCGTIGDRWVWVPFECHYRFFGPSDLARVQKNITILLAGTSVARGNFHHLVKLLLGLPKYERARLVIDNTQKCWGGINFWYNNVRIIYRDYRVIPQILDADKCAPNMKHSSTCREDPRFGTIANQREYLKNAERFWSNYGDLTSVVPNFTYIEHGNYCDYDAAAKLATWYRKVGGTMFNSSRFRFVAYKAWQGDTDWSRVKCRGVLQEGLAESLGAHVIDEYSMSVPLVHVTESYGFTGGDGFSVHHHWHGGDGQLHGPVAEMAAQMLLNMVPGLADAVDDPQAQGGAAPALRCAYNSFCKDSFPFAVTFPDTFSGVPRSTPRNTC